MKTCNLSMDCWIHLRRTGGYKEGDFAYKGRTKMTFTVAVPLFNVSAMF